MACECYKIGGPFIAEDPDCPAHGVDGYEKRLHKLEAEIERLKQAAHPRMEPFEKDDGT